MRSATPPIVLVPACNRLLGAHPFHVAGKKYIDAVRLAGCQPLIVPDADLTELDGLLALAHGILLTGSASNVHPAHFGQHVHNPDLPLDPSRDAWTLPLIPRAIAAGMPLLAICRGAQETNVALGGSLHQAVHEVDGHADHRADDAEPVEVQYGPAHPVELVAGGLLSRLLGVNATSVNSIHVQAVDALAPGLDVEARSPDGVIEAYSVRGTPFGLGVQWHPEWRAAGNPDSMAILRAFGQACRDYRARAATATPDNPRPSSLKGAS